MSNYNQTLGLKLREARQKNHMSLKTVETLTEGRFKASILGAYERGERAITVMKFHALCFIYRTPPSDVLPAGFFNATSHAHRHRWLDHSSGQGVFCGDCPAKWGTP